MEVGSWIEARWRGKFVCASRKHDFSAPTEHDAHGPVRGTIEQVLRGVAFGRKTEREGREEKGSLLVDPRDKSKRSIDISRPIVFLSSHSKRLWKGRRTDFRREARNDEEETRCV